MDMVYDGKTLSWGKHSFKATSGMENFQDSKNQCVKGAGPIPEGKYYLLLKAASRPAQDDGTGTCSLKPSNLLQTIPRGHAALDCEPYWANWGYNRIRLTAANAATRTRCKPARGGFYLHDSTKGYSHGCIEVEGTFFTALRSFISRSRRKRLYLRVKYAGHSTYGGTKEP